MTTVVIAVCAAVVSGFLVAMVMKRTGGVSKESVDQAVSKGMAEALNRASEQLLMLSEERFKTEQAKASGDIETKKQEIHSKVEKLEEQLVRYEALMKSFEEDRTMKFGRLEKQLEHAVRGTDDLRQTTTRLTETLGNVKLRGQWGERMAEDILQYSGLKEGLQYEKQKTLDSSDLRPDYIFNLPENHKVVMDVKFPLSRYNDFVNAENEKDQNEFKKLFINDVKGHIKRLSSKDYTPAAENALDYVLLFIPNEQVYGFINDAEPGLIDETLPKKIILCSPWTLYAVLRIIWQAWQNYNVTEGLKPIIGAIGEFRKEYDKFKKQMDTVGGRLESAQKAYGEMVGVRQRQLDQKIERIDQYGAGHDLIEAEDA